MSIRTRRRGPVVERALPGLLAVFLLGAVLLGGACTETNTGSVFKHLDRPSDVTFGCLQFTLDGNTPVTQAVPLANCGATTPIEADAGVAPDAPTQDGGTATSSPIAFVTEGIRGDVAVVDLVGAGNFVDSDPYTPGLNGIPVGRLPIGIAIAPNGCYAAVANAGSCDLALINVVNAYRALPDAVRRMAVTTTAGALTARPGAILTPPSLPAGGAAPDCSAPTGTAWISYPGCHLAARVDLATGQVLDGVRFRAGAAPEIVGPDVTCPAECVAARGPGADAPLAPAAPLDTADAGATGPVDPTAGQPTAIVLEGDGSRLYLGAGDSPTLIVAELGDDGAPTLVRTLALEDARGIRKIALSGDTDMGVPNARSRWAYVIAADGAIHVVDVRRGQAPVECDAQIDRRYLHAVKDARKLICFPVGNPANPPRRVDAQGPGVRLPGGVVPLDLGFIHRPLPDPAPVIDPDPRVLFGTFAVITALGPVDDPAGGRGVVYYINVKDELYPATENANGDGTKLGEPSNHDIGLAVPHTLRDSGVSRFIAVAECSSTTYLDTQSAPRLGREPARSGNYVYNDTGPAGSAFAPSLHRVTCEDAKTSVWELGLTAPSAVRAPLFPDLEKSGVRSVFNGSQNEQILIAWEGALASQSLASRRSGARVEVGQGGLILDSPGALLCKLGVQRGDVLALIGCALDSDCGLGEVCVVHPDAPAGTTGMCLPTARKAELTSLCRPLLVSQRKYTVIEAGDDHTIVVTRPALLYASPIDGCADAAQCVEIEGTLLTEAEATAPAGTTFPRRSYVCEADPAYGGPRRCIVTCQTDSDCDTGSVCETVSGRCVLGPLPPPDCVAPLQNYEYRAGDAFSVTSSQDEYHSRQTLGPDGLCVEDRTMSPLVVQRVPRLLPTCTDLSVTANEPNPCVIPDLVEPVPASSGGVYAFRPAYGIRVRSVGLTFDLTDVAIPFPGLPDVRYSPILDDYTMLLQIAGGFLPLALPLQAALPDRVRSAPGGSLFLLDSGDIPAAATTGQILSILPSGDLSSNRLR